MIVTYILLMERLKLKEVSKVPFKVTLSVAELTSKLWQLTSELSLYKGLLLTTLSLLP